MKNKFRKLLSLLLTALFILNITTNTAFAASKANIDSAVNFITSKGFITGDILNVTTENDGFIFTVRYSPTDETSIIEYHEKNNGIELVFIENTAEDTFLFKNDGSVYINDELFASASNYTITPRDSGGYVYQFFNTRLEAINAWGTFVHGPATCYSDIISFATNLSTAAKPTVAYVIAFYFGAPAAMFYEEAETILNLAVTIAYAKDYLDLVYYVTEDTSDWPLKKMSGYELYFKLGSYQTTSELWEIRILN